ncbi:SIS domain-containing protein [Alphaproteobacteria bacterium GH1-50]|uniref:SIS domain-containing protein n=1 Tax=Kangsaoukella pontilimi TaxID=2691042 RepID=A0A7C9IRX1_9RHOB|nr:MurR/RpiR family transcriptional regulator [Kangsaoukella pontilimi]MXQ07385.1 SIS domain-containing protein [Kangsaoukella pontilimi]
MATTSIKHRIEDSAGQLTAGERKLAAAILADYPFSGLASIQELSNRSEVSTASISRFMVKIGLSGYQEFQRELISELKEGDRSPVEVHPGARQIEGGFLADFLAKTVHQMTTAGDAITEDQFARVCDVLSNKKRAVYTIGGRISDTIAAHLSFHLRQAREGVYHLPQNPESWPDYLLRMKPGDLFFIVDFRRYQTSIETLARQAQQQRGADIVLMTDKWISPIARHASEVLAVPIESGTLWDSYSSALAVTEAIVTRIAEDSWEETRTRIEAWDALRPTGRDKT